MAKKSISGRQLRKMVTDFAEQQQNNTFNYHQVSAALGLKAPAQQRSVALCLAELAFDGDIVEVSPGKYKAIVRTLSLIHI